MKKASYRGSVLLAILIALFPFQPKTALAQPGSIIHKSGTLSSSETWLEGNVYWIDDDLTINPGVVLTIQPGVIVKLAGWKRIIVNGSFQAVGTPGHQIYFTSINDDTVGGDTNGDGALTTPAKNDWGWLEFGDAATANLDYINIRYSGKAYLGSYVNRGALYAAGYSIPVVGDHTTLVNNWVNGIELPAGTLSKSAYTFPYYPAAAYFLSGDLTIPVGVTLTIEPGAIVKLAVWSRIIANGTLQAVGTPDHQTYFTSINDDTVGGDTNGNGALTTPVKNDWGWLEFGDSSASNLDYVTIRYSGKAYLGYYANRGALYAAGYSIPVVGNHTSLTNNWVNGIELPEGILSKSAYTFPYYPAAAYFLSGDLTVPAGVILTLDPGVILKLAVSGRMIINGSFHAAGTQALQIYFTSIQDDTVGGDTNGDGASTTPAKYDWGWLEFGESSEAILDDVTVRYSGKAYVGYYLYHGGIYVKGGMVTVNHANLTSNEIGLEADKASSVTIHQSNLVENSSMV